MKFPANLNLVTAINFAWNWPAAMNYLVKNTTKEEFETAVADYQKKYPKTNVYNGPLRFFAAAIVSGEYPYDTPKKPKNPKAQEALIAEISARLPLSAVWSEADSFAGYLVLSPTQVIGIGEYQNPVKTLNDISTTELAILAEQGEQVKDINEIYETLPEEFPEYLSYFADTLGIKLPMSG